MYSKSRAWPALPCAACSSLRFGQSHLGRGFHREHCHTHRAPFCASAFSRRTLLMISLMAAGNANFTPNIAISRQMCCMDTFRSQVWLSARAGAEIHPPGQYSLAASASLPNVGSSKFDERPRLQSQVAAAFTRATYETVQEMQASVRQLCNASIHAPTLEDARFMRLSRLVVLLLAAHTTRDGACSS
jgi:hypothetical protein